MAWSLLRFFTKTCGFEDSADGVQDDSPRIGFHIMFNLLDDLPSSMDYIVTYSDYIYIFTFVFARSYFIFGL